MKKSTGGTIGLAMAGHAYRASGNEKEAAKYKNPLTDFVNLMIAECKAKQHRQSDNKALQRTSDRAALVDD